MKLVLICFIIISHSFASPLSFKVQFYDHYVKIIAPDKKSEQFSILIENKSLTDLYAKFQAGTQDLLFVAVKSGQFKTFEFKNLTNENVRFVPINPPLQEVMLEFGKKIYEIPEQKKN